MRPSPRIPIMEVNSNGEIIASEFLCRATNPIIKVIDHPLRLKELVDILDIVF